MSNLNNNPYYKAASSPMGQAAGQLIGSGILDGDRNNYNQSTDFAESSRIGTTKTGNTLNSIGNAGLMSGNPYAMAAGLVAKGAGGLVDFGTYMTRDAPDIKTNGYIGENAPVYDLGDEQESIQNMETGGKAFWSGMKKTAMLGGIGSVAGGFAAMKKAKELKAEAQGKLANAQGSFNSANLAYHKGKQSKDIYNAIQAKNDNDSYRKMQGGSSYWSV